MGSVGPVEAARLSRRVRGRRSSTRRVLRLSSGDAPEVTQSRQMRRSLAEGYSYLLAAMFELIYEICNDET